MRLIDADALKKKYRKDMTKNLIDKKRNIDLSKYAKEPCDVFDKYIDEMPTVDVIEQIRAEIEAEKQHIYSYDMGMGLAIALEIIDKYKS